MIAKRSALALLLLAACLAGAPAALAAGAAPAWKLSVIQRPTNFIPGDHAEYFIAATNVGGASTTAPIVLKATLPPGLTPTAAFGTTSATDPESPKPTCSPPVGQEVTCTTSATLHPSRWLGAYVKVDVAPAAPGTTLEAEAAIGGGGAGEVATIAPTTIDPAPPPFGFTPGASGFGAGLTNPDAPPVTQAASHPGQLTVNLAFPIEEPEHLILTAVGHPRNIRAELPRGLSVDPAATAALCTEAQLTSYACPEPSQLGIVNTITTTGDIVYTTEPLYNMVPPEGVPAELGFDAVGVGIFTHITGSVRSDGDYGISSLTGDVLAYPLNPILGATVQIWGDPSGSAHDQIRGDVCSRLGGSCPVEATKTAAITMPSQCSGPITFTGAVDSWEEPGVFHERSVESADTGGTPTGVDGCNAVEFKPTISSRPTTNLADSPTGLDFTLHQPQEKAHLEPLQGQATANLRDAVVTLPPGLVANPSQAGGLEACTTQQIGLITETGQTPIHFDKSPDSCPDAAKIGSLEVTTPLLGEYDESGTELQTDAEGNPIPRPLHGSVYLAKPFANPFGSLLAVYLSIDDPQSGTVAKFAVRVKADPNTGQLTNVVTENPELPLEDVKLHLFGGPRASLVSPPLCGTHTTNTDLVPWSTPEGEDAHPADSFQTTAAPGGGACPTSEGQAANAPSFQAGTISPQAKAYTPFVLKLSREDGSQRLAGIDTTLPAGLSGKLAGIATCSDAEIAQAQSRSHPNEGAIEQADPSCPASSQVGTVSVGAGAGPTPFHTQGNAYLSGPYKSAPLSLTIITPAVAGPFDLGAVVVRTALHLDPETARIHAVSDPFPQILDGIPLDLRSVALSMDRPEFTLNPTSCDPMAITGSALSALGQGAALTSPFQVGGCSSLPFKPKLSLRLRGGTKRSDHPKLIANLKAKPGEANIAATRVQLPRAAFLDQGHIRTVCTRVQFAADACPPGSIYGKATATTPLLGYPISGNVYLRSSSHELPDLVVALKGPASQPIEVDLVGVTDSVKGALRNTFSAVPDAPVSSFHLELFGGKRGLIELSRDLCAHTYRAVVEMDGQNGKVNDTEPAVASDCKKKQKHRKAHRG